MTILPKKKLNLNKTEDGSHNESRGAHHPHSHRDRIDHNLSLNHAVHNHGQVPHVPVSEVNPLINPLNPGIIYNNSS